MAVPVVTVGTARGKSGSWVLRQHAVPVGTAGTVGTVRAKSNSWVLHSTRGYCRVLWVRTAGTVGFGYCGYCRNELQARVLEDVLKVRDLSAARNTYRN